MSKEDDDGLQTLQITNPKIYGYFDKDDNVYKIYQPGHDKYKFIKVENLKSKYKKVITLFDNDKAGHAAINKYLLHFNIKGFYLTLSKDLSDAVCEYGFHKVHAQLKELLSKTLKL